MLSAPACTFQHMNYLRVILLFLNVCFLALRDALCLLCCNLSCRWGFPARLLASLTLCILLTVYWWRRPVLRFGCFGCCLFKWWLVRSFRLLQNRNHSAFFPSVFSWVRWQSWQFPVHRIWCGRSVIFPVPWVPCCILSVLELRIFPYF